MATISYYSTEYKEETSFNKEPARALAHAPARWGKRRGNDLRRERMVLRLAAAAILFVLLFVGLTLVKGNAKGELPLAPEAGEKVIIIGSGDTLWDIASGLRKEGQDIRRIVYDLKERNQLDSSALHAGETLIVPTD